MIAAAGPLMISIPVEVDEVEQLVVAVEIADSVVVGPGREKAPDDRAVLDVLPRRNAGDPDHRVLHVHRAQRIEVKSFRVRTLTDWGISRIVRIKHRGSGQAADAVFGLDIGGDVEGVDGGRTSWSGRGGGRPGAPRGKGAGEQEGKKTRARRTFHRGSGWVGGLLGWPRGAAGVRPEYNFRVPPYIGLFGQQADFCDTAAGNTPGGSPRAHGLAPGDREKRDAWPAGAGRAALHAAGSSAASGSALHEQHAGHRRGDAEREQPEVAQVRLEHPAETGGHEPPDGPQAAEQREEGGAEFAARGTTVSMNMSENPSP